MLNPVPFPVIIPVTFNDDKCVDAPWNIVIPETFNELLIVVILFNNVFPETFNDELNVDELETIKLLKFVLFNKLVLVVFKLLIDKVELLDNEFKFENIVVLDALRFDIDVVWEFNIPKILVLVLCKLDIAVLLLFIKPNNDV